MASKAKTNGLNGAHTAGIYADMTVVGPEIGTLVVIVDRAKNLPNRKSIGKQDPYCAARLGKEAKKTDTVRRGGQTPKWDQELRFTVHDSPDYFQLKVSVFNDDKKTDIIGETWVNLQDVVIPGGGQNDIWHNLSYKGKYAGEIRIEITYYDTRPKQEKVSDKVKQGTLNGKETGQDLMKGPRELKTPVKRRPLPADPTGASPAPSPGPDYVQTQTRGHHTPTYGQGQRPLPADPTGALSSPIPVPDHVHTPSCGLPTPTYIQTQSPLQSLEYNIPVPAIQPQPRYGEGYATRPGMSAIIPNGRPLPDDRYEIYGPASNQLHNAGYDPIAEAANRFAFEPQDPRYNLSPPAEYDVPPSPGGSPPPPPVHRSHHVSPMAAATDAYNFPPTNSPENISIPPAREESYGNSVPDHGQRDSYQPFRFAQATQRYELYQEGNYQSSPSQSAPRHNSYEADNYQQSPPHSATRHHSYEGGNYNHSTPHSAPRHQSYEERLKNHDSIQATVESAPATPLPHRESTSRSPYDDRIYDQVPSPAPLNLTGRGSAMSGSYSSNNSSSQQFYGGQAGNGSPTPYRDAMSSELPSRSGYSQSNQSVNSQSNRSVYSQSSQSGLSQSSQSTRHPNENHMGGLTGGYVPPVPPTLVAGIDPVVAKEISDRIMLENRSSYNQNGSTPPRGRYPDQSHYRQNFYPVSYSDGAPAPLGSAANHDDRKNRMSTSAYTPIVRPSTISPDPRVPLRKSVSPSPGPSPAVTGETRRLSGVPFGPDAYDALNPNIPTVAAATKPVFDPEAKIIMHDGREVDPSDHLPESTWAAEPEFRQAKKPAPRALPPGAQPMPATERRQLRQAGRPHSMTPGVSISPQAPYMSGALSGPSTPTTAPAQAPAGGRNRLQKKTPHRNSAAATIGMPQGSPLAPITPYQDNSIGFTPRSLPRAATVDFAGENGYQGYGGSSSGRGHRNSYGGVPPPIPAKIPMSGPPPEESAWALLEEMKSIDLGNGRARRRV